MKASKLLEIIRKDLESYPIEYLKNKVTDPRYKDPLTKKLAKYNTGVYDEIYSTEITDDFEIRDGVIKNIRSDIGFYFDRYAGGNDETKRFTENISLYLALIAKRPLHPFSDDKSDDVYLDDGEYYCRTHMTAIHDERSLCRYCVCRNVGFSRMFY